jgi:hypothetical protein
MPPEASATVDLSANLPSEQATQQLAAMQTAYDPAPPLIPANAHEADVRLAQLVNDPEWARKLMNGDIATRDEFQKLSELKASGGVGDVIADQSLVSVTQGDTGLTRNQLISTAEAMRAEQVFNDQGIEFILSDQKFAPEVVADAQFWLPHLERDENLLCPDLPDHWTHEHQVKFLRTIVTVGDGSRP